MTEQPNGSITERPFGSWPSPISAALVAAGGTGLGGPAARRSAGEGSEIWWSELRPTEAGRSVLVSLAADGTVGDRLPAPWSARTRVHEYGGGAWWLGAQSVYFANWSDQRLYRLHGGADPSPLTAEPSVPAGWRYADGREHPDGAWLVCVREDHHGIGQGGKTEAANELVGIDLSGDGADEDFAEQVVLVSGADFVSSPRFSPDGRWLSWVQWDHPNMPWETTTLCAAPVFANMRIGNVQVVAGGPDGTESIHGANWTSDGRLVFSSDRTGFWNLNQWTPGSTSPSELTNLGDAEIGSPPWVFGVQPWCELPDGRLVVVITRNAIDHLAVLSESSATGALAVIDTPECTVIGDPVATGDNHVAFVGSGPAASGAVIEMALAGPEGTTASRQIRPPDDLRVDTAWFSSAEAIDYESAGRLAHAFFYPPTAPDLTGTAGELPPLVVMGHGGPTAHSGSGLSAKIQFWTSRGFAVVDVNYGGSSGFGRAYRDLLQGSWGIVDVEDCVNAAKHLAEIGRVDAARLTIRGGSAGGFTVLTALIESDMFAAGTSLYGVADLTALAADTHKFESRYLDGLVGPYPERRDLYEKRSPINRTEGLSSPLLVLQGLEDEIVPPSQSEAIVAAVAAKGVPHAYVAFEGEQHGFRQATNIIRSLEVELWFYGRILGLDPADAIEPPAGAVGLS